MRNYPTLSEIQVDLKNKSLSCTQLVKYHLERIDNMSSLNSFAEVYGHGRQKADTVTYRGAVYDSGDIPRILIELIVRDERLKEVVDTILETARTGKIGDGKIIVTDVVRFMRIRTAEKDEDGKWYYTNIFLK